MHGNENILSIDIGGSKVILGLVSVCGEISETILEPIPPGTGKDGLLELIYTAYDKLTRTADLSHVTACGVTVPGLADPEKGLWVHAVFSGIANLPIAGILKERFGVPVFIENDVNACAMAEIRFGGAKDTGDFLWVTVSNGIGGALVLNGQLYSGSCGNAGELGHVKVEPEPGDTLLLCGCGDLGCLEAMASGTGIARRYCAAAGIEWDGVMRSKEVSERVSAGDEAARRCFEVAGAYLGAALGNAANLINPAKIFIGGGVVMDFDLFAPRMNEDFRRVLFRKANPVTVIEKTHLGYNAALLGAAAIALR